MTTYFTAPDGHGEPTLWMRTDNPDFPRPVLSRSKLDQTHHWDELVARVIAGNPSAQQMSWREALRNPQDHDVEWGTPVDRREITPDMIARVVELVDRLHAND